MPPSPLNPPLGCFGVRGQNARKSPLPSPHSLKSEGAGGHRCGRFPEKSYPQESKQVLIMAVSGRRNAGYFFCYFFSKILRRFSGVEFSAVLEKSPAIFLRVFQPLLEGNPPSLARAFLCRCHKGANVLNSPECPSSAAELYRLWEAPGSNSVPPTGFLDRDDWRDWRICLGIPKDLRQTQEARLWKVLHSGCSVNGCCQPIRAYSFFCFVMLKIFGR